jgi:hypothetical protein
MVRHRDPSAPFLFELYALPGLRWIAVKLASRKGFVVVHSADAVCLVESRTPGAYPARTSDDG